MSDVPMPIGRACSNIALAQPGRVAVVCGDASLTWRELQQRSNRMAHAMRARSVGQDDIVALVLPDAMDVVVASLAIWKLGASPQPLSPSLTRVEIERLLAVTKPAVLLAERDRWIEGVACVAPSTLLAESEREDDPPDAVATSWLINSSSGSTGQPKVIRSAHDGRSKPAMTRAWRLSGRDTALIAAPLTHGAPFICCFCALLCGATVVLMPRFQEENALALVERHEVTWMLLVPTMMSRIWRLPGSTRQQYRMSSVQTVWHVGAPCPPHVKEAWINWLGPEVIWEIYAATDGCACTVIDGTGWLAHRGSVGTVADGEIQIVDERGDAVAPGTAGEVCMRRKPGESASYHYLSAETRKRDADGWERTGDIGWMDASGYLYLGDRLTDMILVGGANVFPAEIEAALEEHPEVQSSAVIGLPDDDLGNRIHAIVQLRSDVSEQELATHLAGRLARYKHPRSFEYVREPLRDEAGKIHRYRLRQERVG